LASQSVPFSNIIRVRPFKSKMLVRGRHRWRQRWELCRELW